MRRPSRVVPVLLAAAAIVALLVFLGVNRLTRGPSLERPTPSRGLEIQPVTPTPTTTGG